METMIGKWYCDECGNIIESPEDGYVIWKKTEDNKAFGFKIIHQTKCDDKTFPSSVALNRYLGIDGMARLLALLSVGQIHRKNGIEISQRVVDVDEFIDLVRRIQTPLYEEARKYFGDPEVLANYGNDNESRPYTQENLEIIISEYGAKS